MSLDEFAAVVFRRGCGISLQYATRVPRYRQLVDEATELELPEPKASALVELLGERLADRAFRNLPKAIRDSAAKWHDGIHAQKEILHLLHTQLLSSRWQRGRRKKYAYNSDIRSVLPHEMQSWQRGRVMPNCLGVAQMLVGFARAAGAPHYLANVVRTFEHEILDWEVRSLRIANKTIGRLPTRNQQMIHIARKLRKGYEQALLNANTRHHTEAHHVLILQLADNTWWVVDPYLDAYYSLGDDQERDMAVRLLDGAMRNRVLLMTHARTDPPPHTRTLHNKLLALGYMYALIGVQFRPGKMQGSILPALGRAVAYVEVCESKCSNKEFLFKLAELTESVPEDIPNKEQFDHAFAFTMLEAADPDLDERKLMPRLHRSLYDTALQQRLAWRIVAFYLQRFIDSLDELYSNRAAREHECLELAQPSLMLGVATLNHMRSRMPVRLGGLLSMLSSSQWVLSDTLAAEQSADPIRHEYRQTIITRLEVLRNGPANVLIPPLQYLKYRSSTKEQHD